MKIIITDTGTTPVQINSDDFVIRNIDSLHSCIACFDCWVKTPGICVWKDDLKHLGEAIAISDELIIVSAMTYGSYSSYVKTVLERCLSYFLPSFVSKTKYKTRYKNHLKISAYFYGSQISDGEKAMAIKLMENTAELFSAKLMNVIFLKDASEVGGGVQ